MSFDVAVNVDKVNGRISCGPIRARSGYAGPLLQFSQNELAYTYYLL